VGTKRVVDGLARRFRETVLPDVNHRP
jgi:hypothetical protein